MAEPNTKYADFSIVAAENKFLTRESDLHFSRPGLWPSEASVEYQDDFGKVVDGTCMRKSFYRALGFDKDEEKDPNLSMKGEMGKRAEQGCMDRWKGMGIWVDNNVKFYSHELLVSGELDAVVKHEEPGMEMARIGVEVKSFYGYYPNKMICGAKRPPTPGVPKMDQFLQALVYKGKYKDLLDQYRLYYVERGDGHRVEFEVGLTEDQPWWRQIPGPYWGCFSEGQVNTPFKLSDVHARYKELIKFIRSRTLPPRDYSKWYTKEEVEIQWARGRIGKTKYDKWKKNPAKNKLGDWHCSYCPYQKRCANDSVGESKE